MKLRIIFPTWHNARHVDGVHEAPIFDNLRKGIIAGLERHENDVAWGEGVTGPACLTLRGQLRDTKKPAGWQHSSLLTGVRCERLAELLIEETDRMMRGVPSWRPGGQTTGHILPGECVWMPFSLSSPDAVACSARLGTSGYQVGRALARWLSLPAPLSVPRDPPVYLESKKDEVQTLHQNELGLTPAALSAGPSPSEARGA